MVKFQLKKENKNITLTGLMGCGKTTIGKYIAHQLKKTFIDTDQIIEEKEARSIPEIFEQDGEAYFRKVEKEVIKEVLQSNDQVVSLGGGAIVDPESREIIKEHSFLITLIADPKDLHARVKRRKNRPLLNDEKSQLKTLEKLWDERKPAYMDSHFQIRTTGKSINLVSAEIMRLLGLKKPKVQEQEVNIPRQNFRYKIYFKDLFRLNIDSLNPGKQILIVSQEPIAKHYLSIVEEKLQQGYKVSTMIIENGEDAKNFFTYQLILQKLLSLNFERKDTVIALGGGVVGDIAGFAASTYYRGINYVQVPTTLLSMIDSSVGGKTAINVPEGKNLIGSFYQPHMVHIDVNNLKTLPDSEYRSGLGELVKYTLLGLNWDEELGDSFFDFVSNHVDEIIERDSDMLSQIINHCLRIKAGIVSEDETEKGLRAHLNLGHTFGHALEEITKYQRYSHGEAVAIGLITACYLAEELGYFKDHQTNRVKELMKNLDLSYSIPDDISTDEIIASFQYDKKTEAGIPKFIIPKATIGRVEIVPKIPENTIRRAIERNRASAKS
jgi:shikimate kinase / 3-dehydroquinate synthase